MKQKVTLVFAGNHMQYKQWVKEELRRIGQSFDEDSIWYVFVQGARDIDGRRDFEIATVGTWYENPKICEALKYAEKYKNLTS